MDPKKEMLLEIRVTGNEGDKQIHWSRGSNRVMTCSFDPPPAEMALIFVNMATVR